MFVRMAESSVQPLDLEHEVQVLLDSTKLRYALHRNNIVQNEHEATQRHLQRQCRHNLHEISREEKEMRHQLERLYVEQNTPTFRDNDDDDGDLPRLSAFTFSETESVDGSEPGVTNPYPVTIVARKISAPSKLAGKQKEGYGTGKPWSAGRRRQSVEFEDLLLVTATGKILPPVGQSGTPVVSLGSLSKTGSLSPLHMHSPSDKREFWVGNPEAISSVRRACKVGLRRRPELAFRSRNTPDMSKLGALRRQELSRSQSLKGLKEPATPESVSQVIGRSNSCKEGSRYRKRGTALREGSPFPEQRSDVIGQGRLSRRSQYSPLSSTSSLRDASLSPANSPRPDQCIHYAAGDSVTSHMRDRAREISRDFDPRDEGQDERLYRRRRVQLRELSNVQRSSQIPTGSPGISENNNTVISERSLPIPIGPPGISESSRMPSSSPSFFLTESSLAGLTPGMPARRQDSLRGRPVAKVPDNF